MTSFANKMQIFLWQIAIVIPIKGTRTSVNMPGFQTKSLTITIVCGNDFWIFQLGNIFAKPKDRVPTDWKIHAVYSIPCADCEKE